MVIAGYEVIQEIGSNGREILYRGRRNSDRQPVLLKIPLRHPLSAFELKMLEREYEVLRELEVAGIPRAYELIRVNDAICLVLEDLDGAPLRNLLAAGPLNLNSFFEIALKISALLAELHKREINHQSINPENILINDETVWLIGFGLAWRDAGETQAAPATHLPYSSLLYISPEQTGRMNRSVDLRTDCYSLGATFYEMLTGQAPFRHPSGSEDALELIYQHIAGTPRPPAEINTAVPEPLSRIVLKLLAKMAEDRYQSAQGLREDLEHCAREWSARGRIDPFPLGRRAAPERFLIPQKLYGRGAEVKELLGAFARVCEADTSQASMILVAGYSGVGKTSLIQVLDRPIARERGYFISGKFDQVVRNVPYGALIQAFRGLIEQLLTESDERLAGWRTRLSEALGAQGGVLTEVIPEIELIIGRQPAPPALGPTEALNRFQMAFQNFVGAITADKRPLVIFLDDLQWADPATLSLFHWLLICREIHHLMLIGAYRENEVDTGHLLARTLDALESADADLRRIELGPLELPDLGLFISDILHSTPADVDKLARMVLQKTGGNPFFVIQFLKMLKQEGLLKYDYEQACWAYRLEEIAGAMLTENVIDLMTRKIQRLAPRTQRALTLAACIGNPFDLESLAIVSQQSPEKAADALKEAINEGLILKAGEGDIRQQTSRFPASQLSISDTYAFLHDRVQQAAYELISEEWKRPAHLTIGRLLYEHADREMIEKKLFDIVHHLNIGSSLMDGENERIELARLNLSAGRKARSATAYAAARDYFKAGACLLGESHWESFYELTFSLHFEAAECEYLCGDFDAATGAFDLLLECAQNKLDKARVYSLRMVEYENMSRYDDALASARAGLALFGVSLPDSPESAEHKKDKKTALENELTAIQSLLGSRSIESLIELPVMTDPEIRMVMRILTDIWASTYLSGDATLAQLISATLVRLSLMHGNLAESAYGYVTHAITVGPVRGDYRSAYEFGRLALRVNERFNDSKLRAKIYQQFHAHVNLWRQPLQTCIPYAREACRSGLGNGDFLYAAYGAATEAWAAFVSYPNLAQFLRDYTPALALIRRLKNTGFADAHQLMLNWARALRGEIASPLALSSEEFDEEGYAESYRCHPFFMMFYQTARLHLNYLFGEYEKAVEEAQGARRIAHNMAGTIWTVLVDFWGGLALAAVYGSADAVERAGHLTEIKRSQAALAILAENCPENYLCPSLLLAAEIERIAGLEMAALDFYEQAIRSVADTSMIQYQALANELYARFWLDRGQTNAAAVFLAEARENYSRWGAVAKVEELGRRYAELLKPQPNGGARAAAETGALDRSSVMKAAQAITGEIELKKLPAKLLRIAIENAGAQRGSLILEHGAEFFVHAAEDSEEARVISLNMAESLPQSIVNYVRRTSECVVLDDARSDTRYGGDPYISLRRPRSVMCLPIRTQERLAAVLYLENNLISGAFTAERIQALQTVSAQAAISLENALLYDEARRAEETLRSVVEGTAAVTGGDFFAMLVRHLTAALRVKYAFVTECRGEKKAKTLAFWNGDGPMENVEYDITETPCFNVLKGDVCHYPKGVQELFPKDQDLVEMHAEGYLGVPLYDATGTVIGHLAVLDVKPMTETARELPLLKIFAARAGAELERLRVDAELRAALAEVERLKNRFQAENVYLQEEIRQEHNIEEIVGSSPALLALLREVERVAPTDSTVLIFGETGTGKELIGRAIHNLSARKDRPLVKVNCGAISAGLVESELFGHVKGAFTGAFERRTGRFELADGGTLFLDEVGELPFDTQVKLLRALQEGEFEPVGSSRTIRVDVRIIAATNRNLEEAVREGRFRADLFYRLHVLPLRVPALGERRSDIPQLAMFFLARFARKFGKKVEGVSQETMDLLVNYSWPGNIRELQNIIERGMALAENPVLSLSRNLFPAPPFKEAGPSTPATSPSAADKALSLEEIERRHILAVLEQTLWVIEGPQGAAKVLDLHPNTLRGRMKKLGIQRPGAH